MRSEAESILLEGKLIKEYRPRYNISFRDDKRFLLVKVDMSEEWPRFRLARFKKNDNARYFGPYADAGALRQTLNLMRKKFGVLTFGRGAPTERELKSATYQVPMRLSEITAEQYRERAAQACEFLEGHSREMIDALKEQMNKSAGKMDFEKAAELRDMIEDVRRTTKPMRRFTRGSLPSAVDPMADVQALADALQLSNPPRVMECFDISNISTTHVVASMVCFRNGLPDRDCYRRYRIRTVEGQDDFASMAEVVRRRYSRILLEAREENPDAAEFSQEQAVEGLRRLERQTPNAQRSNAQRTIGRPKSPGACPPAQFDHCRWRERPAFVGLPRVAAARPARFADHRSGQGTRRDLPSRPRAAVAVAARFRRASFASADSRRGPSLCQCLSPVASEETCRREYSRRLSRCESESKKSSFAQVWLRESTAQGERRRIAATEGIGRKLAEEVHRFLAAALV